MVVDVFIMMQFEVCRCFVCFAWFVDGDFVTVELTHLWGAGMGLITAEMGLSIAEQKRWCYQSLLHRCFPALLAWTPGMLVELLVLILRSGMRLLRLD